MSLYSRIVNAVTRQYEFAVFIRKDGKVFFFLSILFILLLCNGCIISDNTYRFCDRMNNEVQILERRGELSNDGQHLTVYVKKQTNYCRDPFKIRRGSVVEELSHVYSLTTPEPDALQKEFQIIIDEREYHRIALKNFEINDGQEAKVEPNDKVDLGRLILPVFSIWISDAHSTIYVHPDDFNFLSQPFTTGRSLIIPYKRNGNIIYAYCPKEDLLGLYKHFEGTTGALRLSAVLGPPAFVLDIVTFPVQTILVVFGLYDLNWH